jgi:mono/diheme cytochrome c family protein
VAGRGSAKPIAQVDWRSGRWVRSAPRVIPLLALLLLTSCDYSMRLQRKYATYAPSDIWADGASARPLPENVVAQGDLARRSIDTSPPPVTEAFLDRGRERFDIYCAPCHGLSGDGDGVIVAHGFPKPPSYHIDRLLAATPQHLYDVISNGYGVMFSYSDRVEPEDRWAIVAYIRALQLSRHATVAEAPEAKETLQ